MPINVKYGEDDIIVIQKKTFFFLIRNRKFRKIYLYIKENTN